MFSRFSLFSFCFFPSFFFVRGCFFGLLQRRWVLQLLVAFLTYWCPCCFLKGGGGSPECWTVPDRATAIVAARAAAPPPSRSEGCDAT